MTVNTERTVGAIYNDILQGPEYRTKLLPSGRTRCVVGVGSSDTGKGWVTASIGANVANPLMVKFDPMMNRSFPYDVGVDVEGVRVTDDFRTYEQVGLRVHPVDNIIAGGLMGDYLESVRLPPEFAPGKTKKQTYADVSDYLAHRLARRLMETQSQNMCMEIGGIVPDFEQQLLPGALRRLAQLTGVTPEIVLLAQFAAADVQGSFRLKTQGVRQGIRDTMARYAGLPLSGVLIRRNFIPADYPEDILNDERHRIAYEAQIDPDSISMLHEHPDVASLAREVGTLPFMQQRMSMPMVSACMVGVNCRFKGNNKIDHRALDIMAQHGGASVLCPEVLGGLSTPRARSRIEDGMTGHDVLDGKARVLTEQGDDVTGQFVQGAVFTLHACRSGGVTQAFLKSESPSCGTKGPIGVTAALLERWGIELISSDDMEK